MCFQKVIAMKKSLFVVSLLVVGLFLSGCAMKPPPYVEPPENPRIGFMVLTDDKPQHFHVGTMRHQNFIRSGISEWEFKSELDSYAMEKFDGVGGQQLILIEPTAGLKSQATKMIKPGWDRLLFNDALERHVLESVEGNDLDFLLTVEPVYGDIEYGTPVQASNYGLYTRCHFIHGCNAQALLHFTVRAYALNPIRLAAMLDMAQVPVEQKDFTVVINWPEDVKTLSAQEVDRAKGVVMKYAFGSIDLVARNAGFKSR